MLLHCHCERPTGVRQSRFVNMRLRRHFTPRKDHLFIAFALVNPGSVIRTQVIHKGMKGVKSGRIRG